jgi:hypothetical protein
LKGIELPVPEAFVVADPFRAGMQRARIQAAGVHATLHVALDESRALEHLDVLGRTGQRDVEGRGKLADRARLPGKRMQHRAPGGVGERAEDGVEAGGLINHAVEYTSGPLIVNRLVKYIFDAGPRGGVG